MPKQSCKASAAPTAHHILAANLQPESQKLLWRLRAALGRLPVTGRIPNVAEWTQIFLQEDQKDRSENVGVRAAAGGLVRRCAPNGAPAVRTEVARGVTVR